MPTFYIFQHFLYERTLSPLNIYEIVLDSLPDKTRVLSGDVSFQNDDSFKISTHRLCLLSLGIIYTTIKLKYFYDMPKSLSYLDTVKYLFNFIKLLTITQLVHFNRDAMYIAFFLSLPYVQKLIKPNFEKGNYLFGILDCIVANAIAFSSDIVNTSKKLLNDERYLYAIAVIVVAKYTHQKLLTSPPMEAQEIAQPIISKKITVGIGLSVLVGAGLWAYRHPSSVSQALDGVKRFFGRSC